MAYSSASFTIGLRSSRFLGLSGLELKPRFVTSSPISEERVMPALPFRESAAVYGTSSMKSAFPASKSAIIEVGFV